MLTNTLNTNEIKTYTSAEVEFERISISDESSIFKQINEDIANPNRLTIKHQTVGSGDTKTRRSLVRFDVSVTNTSGKKGVVSAYMNLVVPVGILENTNAMKQAISQLLSFCATTGAGTTVLFDCSGSGAAALLNETL